MKYNMKIVSDISFSKTLNENHFKNNYVQVVVIVQFLLEEYINVDDYNSDFFCFPFFFVCFLLMPVKYPFYISSRKCQPHNHYDKFR